MGTFYERCPRPNKYRAHKVEWRGVMFDSMKEARRYEELYLLAQAREITGLKRQVRFLLIPEQRDPKTGKLLERKCEYIADFEYYTKTGEHIVEDTKGMKTEVYKIKRKLMLEVHGIRIREV